MHPYVRHNIIYNRHIMETECPSLDEWIKEMRRMYPMEYYSSIKNDETVGLFLKYSSNYLVYILFEKLLFKRHLPILSEGQYTICGQLTR